MLNNIDKKLEPIGDNEETKRLADLEKIEFDVMQGVADWIREDFEKNGKPGETLTDYLKSKDDDYFKRIELKDGGKVILFSDYFKTKEPAKIKQLDLASHFKLGKTISSLSSAEKEVVNKLLQMSLGKDK
jgi:hypothetical protein|tara:strand:+ start:285 stop:674 length:390 start_codon:yes stop_codon:yes gene_type:complete